VSEPNVEDLKARLSAPFDPSEVKFKPAVVSGNRALALAYVDARVIQDRLDDVLGVDGWQDDYEALPDGSVICRLRLKLGAEWITKVDVGGQSEQPDGGDRMKAAVSDALKRAAVKFGIGRYLYRLPQQWVDYNPAKRQFVNPPQLAAPTAPRKTKAAAPANGKSLPADGAELLARLKDYESKLVAQGLCKPGELTQYVLNEGARRDHPKELAAWSGAQIGVAADAVKAAEEWFRGRKAGAPQQPDDSKMDAAEVVTAEMVSFLHDRLKALGYLKGIGDWCKRRWGKEAPAKLSGLSVAQYRVILEESKRWKNGKAPPAKAR